MENNLTGQKSEPTGLLRTDKMIHVRHRHLKVSRGVTLLELIVVLTISGILTAIAVPQMITQRRLTRSTGVTREIMTQIRLARQSAMSQRQAITFQYDSVARTINIIDHNNIDTVANPNSGLDVLTAGGYPMTAAATVVSTYPLSQGGLASGEISWGIPAGLPGAPTTADGLAVPNIALSNNRLNITFQRDGSVIDSTGNPVDQAIFIYNNQAPLLTAAAISVRGSTGKVKIWRYNNVDAYIE